MVHLQWCNALAYDPRIGFAKQSRSLTPTLTGDPDFPILTDPAIEITGDTR